MEYTSAAFSGRGRDGRRRFVVLRGVTRMPVLGQELSDHHRFGRPRLSDQSTPWVEYAAWVRDSAGRSINDVARILYGAANHDADPSPHGRARRRDRKTPITQRDRAQARRDIDAGRRSYSERGVLPWAAYPDGQVPGEWWRDHRFWDAVREWERAAILNPEPATERDAPSPAHVRDLLDALIRRSNKAATLAVGLTRLHQARLSEAVTLADRLGRAEEVPLRAYPD